MPAKKSLTRKRPRSESTEVFLSLLSNKESRHYELAIDPALSPRQSARNQSIRQIERILPDIQRRVHFVDPLIDQWMKTARCELGVFPVRRHLSDDVLVAFYIAVMAERDFLALAQIRWPETLKAEDFAPLVEPPGLEGDADTALLNYLFPRYLDSRAPYEFLPTFPRGLMLPLVAYPNDSAFGEALQADQKQTLTLSCIWHMNETVTPPVVAWKALRIAERYLGGFTSKVEKTAALDGDCALSVVEIFPQVTAFGHAALWLAALRDENLSKRGRAVKWPTIYADDYLYMSTFGNDNTKRLVAKYLGPLPKQAVLYKEEISFWRQPLTTGTEDVR